MRRFFKLTLALAFVAGIFSTAGAAVIYEASAITPPKPMREFRAAWVPSVGENSWLVIAGTNTASQKATIIAMMDRAVALKLNAVIFQVRPACDALYLSKIEPWSEQLTGTMGKAPWPYYDPLAFAIEEAHKRGLELHAWFNPYRALHPSAKSMIALNHIAHKRPDLVRIYGPQYVLDPGERDVQDYTLSVIMDVLKRYDVDGIHFDDYFYPYPEINQSGKVIEFPDDVSWKKFGVNSGLSRDDWRRENVNSFVQRVYSAIKAVKPWVKFGIGPFGIWRKGFPAQIKGLDAYASLYADSRKWLASGWVDYLAPQLYWPIEPAEHSFPTLLQWWADQNVMGRILVAGLDTADTGVKWNMGEFLQQMSITRHVAGVSGQVHYSLAALMRNNALAMQLRQMFYAETALMPAPTRSLGFDDKVPMKPVVVTRSKIFEKGVRVDWASPTNQMVGQWLVQYRNGGGWTNEVLGASQMSRAFAVLPEVVAVSAESRYGVLSAPTVIELRGK
jgi:uncharacterized lipoprotein YddW (UPF0748 family)